MSKNMYTRSDIQNNFFFKSIDSAIFEHKSSSYIMYLEVLWEHNLKILITTSFIILLWMSLHVYIFLFVTVLIGFMELSCV